MPSIALAAVLSGIYNFALFDITYLLTGGGPSGSTTTLPLLLYNQAFRALDQGRAAAIGLVIFGAGLVALGVVFRLVAADAGMSHTPPALLRSLGRRVAGRPRAHLPVPVDRAVLLARSRELPLARPGRRAAARASTSRATRTPCERADLFRWMGTSLAVAVSTTVLSLAVSAPLAFALARLRFRGRRTFSGLLVLHYAVPSVTIAVPLFVLLVALGQYNSLFALVIVHCTLTIPFCTWVLRDFYEALPVEIEEAGYVDGAGLRQVLRRIVLPLSMAALLAAGAYAFILSWNDFLFAFILINTQENFTAPVGINAFFTGRNIEQSTWAQLMAASTLVSLPSAILFVVFQRYLVSGFLSGSVRG